MSRTAPPRADAGEDPGGEAGFTLTELAAGLLVAAMLVSGLAEVTRQFARASVRVNADLAQSRGLRSAEAAFLAIERADPGAVSVSVARVAFEDPLGGQVVFQLIPTADGARRLEWAGGARSVVVPATARFEESAGVIRLQGAPEAPPLLVVAARREAPFDCRYDVVSRRCR